MVKTISVTIYPGRKKNTQYSLQSSNTGSIFISRTVQAKQYAIFSVYTPCVQVSMIVTVIALEAMSIMSNTQTFYHVHFLAIPLHYLAILFAFPHKTVFCMNWIRSDFCFEISNYQNLMRRHSFGKLTLMLGVCTEFKYWHISYIHASMLCDAFIPKLKQSNRLTPV